MLSTYTVITFCLIRYPPFAYGGHFVLSWDSASFVSRNRFALRGVGTLEDVSVSTWLMTYGAQPKHFSEFADAHTSENEVECNMADGRTAARGGSDGAEGADDDVLAIASKPTHSAYERSW